MDVPYLFCNYLNRHRTNCSTRKLPDQVVVGLQQYSARTFHVTLSPPEYIRAGRDSLKIETTITTPKAIQATTQEVGYYAPCSLNLYKSLCSLHHQVPELVNPLPTILLLRISLSMLGG